MSGKSAIGLDGNIASALGYPIGIIALILVFMEKDNRFVKFHALQSIFLHLGFIVLMIAWAILTVIITIILGLISNTLALLGSLLWLVYLLIFLGYIGLLIFAAVKSYGGNMTKLPLVGGFAEKFAG